MPKKDTWDTKSLSMAAVLLSVAAKDQILGGKTGNAHGDDGTDDADDDHWNQEGLIGVIAGHEANGGTDKHDGHKTDEPVADRFYLAQMDYFGDEQRSIMSRP